MKNLINIFIITFFIISCDSNSDKNILVREYNILFEKIENNKVELEKCMALSPAKTKNVFWASRNIVNQIDTINKLISDQSYNELNNKLIILNKTILKSISDCDKFLKDLFEKRLNSWINNSNKIEWNNNEPIPQKAEPDIVEIQGKEPLEVECNEFINCIMSRKIPKTSGVKGLKVLEVLSNCQKSLELGGKSILIDLGREGFYIHETSILEKPYKIGRGTKIWHFSHIIQGSKISQNCNIGQNVVIGPNVTIGNRVKIQNNGGGPWGFCCRLLNE